MRTGATLLVKEGIKACAKQDAKEFMQEVASSVAAEMANYAATLCGFTEEQKQWLRVGVDAYQAFAFFKAARTKVDWNGSCFAAGTRVIVGRAADGSLLTRPIEQVRPGDWVLSRDQYNAGDDLQPHRVTEVFRKTSDHLRVLRIAGDDGNIETIRTTDSHPFFVAGRGWTDAGSLQVGDQIQETDGTWQTVLGSGRQSCDDGIAVYNFEVEGDHTYFVEDGAGPADAVWVHNATGGVCSIRSQPRPVRDMPGQVIGKPHHPTTTLMKNMEKAGVPFVSGASPHHLVSGGSASAAPARAVFDKHGIDINQADNGVYLTAAGRQSPDPSLPHGATFSHQNYGKAVSDRLEAADLAGGKNKVLEELEAIREDLLSGNRFWEVLP